MSRAIATMVAAASMLVAIAAMILALLATAPAVLAHSPCDPTDNDREQASRVIARLVQAETRLVNEIDEFERAVIEALRRQTGQLSGYTAESTKTLVEALDSKMALESQLAREIEEAETAIAHRPHRSGCETATGATGLAPARAAAAAAAERGDIAETGRIVRDLAAAPVAGLGDPSAATDRAARFSAVVGTYCESGRAAGDGGGCSGPEGQHAADLRPASLFDQATLADEDALRAAIEYGRNIAAPVVRDPLPVAAVETDAQRGAFLMARAADARTAAAADYFTTRRAARAPGVDLGPWAAALGGGVRDPGTPVSRHELLGILASGRFDDPQWFVALQEMPAEALLRELAALMAVGLILDWERYGLDERRGGLDAATLAVAVDSDAGR